MCVGSAGRVLLPLTRTRPPAGLEHAEYHRITDLVEFQHEGDVHSVWSQLDQYLIKKGYLGGGKTKYHDGFLHLRVIQTRKNYSSKSQEVQAASISQEKEA
ncbi:hypothetical protein RRG08_036487 [Elysia crispata]|uniref:Uncharacterized protein n=1 Tax=Elysia crispata TaxID=231223 RepID=A0AAE0ZK06_9GAST|nr:hypothetical protein RRG08_036487 [Elysia crispata]